MKSAATNSARDRIEIAWLSIDNTMLHVPREEFACRHGAGCTQPKFALPLRVGVWTWAGTAEDGQIHPAVDRTGDLEGW